MPRINLPSLPDGIGTYVTDALPADQWHRLSTWRERVFPVEGKDMQWSDLQHHVIAEDAEGAIANIGFDLFNVLADGQAMDMLGIGGVVVMPDYQGRHLPQHLFQRVREYTKKRFPGLPLALFCPPRLISYYKKHNFQLFNGKVTYLQGNLCVDSTFPFMSDVSLQNVTRIDLTTHPW